MESLSPLVRNSSVRRLSLELCQKFAANLLSSPRKYETKEVCSGGGRRASEANNFLLSPNSVGGGRRRASLTTQYQTSPLSSPLFNNLKLSPNKSDSVFGPSPKNSSTKDQSEEHKFDNKRRRTSPIIQCNIIPPTPGRKSSISQNQNNASFFQGEETLKQKNKKRRSSSVVAQHYGLDGEFSKMVQSLCGLELSQDEELLGRGSFGTVLPATYKGEKVAVKVISHVKNEEQLQGEINGLNLPPHPHIVKVHELLRVPSDRALVILERMETGNLLSLINDPDVPLRLERVVDISRQVASALTFCHSQGILHLDVKPQNILLHSTGNIKLSDFGNSRKTSDLRLVTSFTKLDGTVGYKAPELFRGERPTEKCDVYSLAITMWQLFTREQPYLGEVEHSVIYKVVAQGLRPKSVCDFYPHSSVPGEERYIRMYEKAWDANPNTRQSMRLLQNQLKQLYKLLVN